MNAKLFLKNFLMIAALTTIMASCKKDDETPTHGNFFQVENEVKIILTKGYVLDHGVHGVSGDPSVRHMHCDFMTDGLNYDQTNEDFYGKGSRVSIAFFTNMDGQIPTGTYTFDHNELNEAFTFDSGFIWEDHDTETGVGHVHNMVDGHVIVVNDENNNYDFSWYIKLDTGLDFYGTYKGQLNYKDVE